MTNFTLFAYDFPHRKTQDFLLRLHLEGRPPSLVVASPPKALSLPPTSLRDKVRHIDPLHPSTIAKKLGIPYLRIAHDAPELPAILGERGVRHGLIAGARILQRSVIEALPGGILNFHPGIIPFNRGLHAAKWAVKLGLPQGITAHRIDSRVDAGAILGCYLIEQFEDDSLRDINLRLYEAQLCVLADRLQALLDGEAGQPIPAGKLPHHPPADEALDRVVEAEWPRYRREFARSRSNWGTVPGFVASNDSPSGPLLPIRALPS